MFTGDTHDALDGQLCPWPYGLSSPSGPGCSESVPDSPCRIPDDQPGSDGIFRQAADLSSLQRDLTLTSFPHRDNFGNSPTTNCRE